jgi:hypothetical protein
MRYCIDIIHHTLTARLYLKQNQNEPQCRQKRQDFLSSRRLRPGGVIFEGGYNG